MKTESNNELPIVISDREILHKASFNSGPQITRVQIIEYKGKRTEVNFWTENGKLVRVTENASNKKQPIKLNNFQGFKSNESLSAFSRHIAGVEI